MVTGVPQLGKAEVNYRQGTLEEHCGNCAMFTLANGATAIGRCNLVIGIIDASGVCDRWEARISRE